MEEQEYTQGNWAVLSIRRPDESKIYTIVGIHSWVGDYPEIEAIDLDAAIRIVDCLAENTV